VTVAAGITEAPSDGRCWKPNRADATLATSRPDDRAMRRMLKFLHVLGAIGMTGALICHAALLANAPDPASLSDHAQVRADIALLSRWVLLPSLAVTVISGLLALGFNKALHDAGWAWLKALLGVVVFEGTLLGVQGPAEKAARVATARLEGTLDEAAAAGLMHSEWGALWVILSLAVANIVLGVWRPRLGRRSLGDAIP